MALQEILNKPLNKPLTAGAKYEAAIAEPIEQIGKTQQEIGEFEATKAEDLSRREATKTKSRAESTRAMREEIATSPERGMLKSTEEQLMNASFVPTQDNAKDLAGLFSLINVIGFAIGRGGKGNAQAAMSAMNGMAEGYQKGRADLYKKEKDLFDTSMKSLKVKSDILGRRLKEISELAAVNKQAADEDADVLFAEQGADFLKKYKDKYGLAATVEFWKQVAQAKGKATELTLKEEHDKEVAAATERRHREDMAQRERAAKEQSIYRQKLLDAKSAAAAKGTTLKPGGKVTEGYIADNLLKADVQELKNDLKNPVLIENLKKYKVEAFLTEEGKILNQLLSEDIPADLQKFLTKVIDIRNNYYLNISGKAVTGGEALRNYGTVPQPGDSAERMVNKLDGMSNRIDQQIALKRELFGLPELNVKFGMKSSLKPNEDYSLGSQKTYEVNKVYTDDKGNKAKYLGNDEWEEL
jgi:hypothetical protein